MNWLSPMLFKANSQPQEKAVVACCRVPPQPAPISFSHHFVLQSPACTMGPFLLRRGTGSKPMVVLFLRPTSQGTPHSTPWVYPWPCTTLCNRQKAVQTKHSPPEVGRKPHRACGGFSPNRAGPPHPCPTPHSRFILCIKLALWLLLRKDEAGSLCIPTESSFRRTVRKGTCSSLAQASSPTSPCSPQASWAAAICRATGRPVSGDKLQVRGQRAAAAPQHHLCRAGVALGPFRPSWHGQGCLTRALRWGQGLLRPCPQVEGVPGQGLGVPSPRQQQWLCPAHTEQLSCERPLIYRT